MTSAVLGVSYLTRTGANDDPEDGPSRGLLKFNSRWNPYIHARHFIGMTDQLENVQRYFTRRVYYRCKLECKHDYPDRLVHLQLESLELRRLYNDITMVYKIVHKLTSLNDDVLNGTINIILS